MSNLELERFEFMPLIKYNLRSTWRMLLLFLQLSPGMHLIIPHQIELPPSLPLPTPPPSLSLPPVLFCFFYHRQWFFFDCFAVPLILLLLLSLSVSLSAAVYSASFAVAETRTQDLFSHLYVCKGRGPRGGARGYVNFSVKIHFVIMDFPCRIHRCRRRCRRPCHDTRHNSSNIHSLSPPIPRTTATITSIHPSRLPPVALCFWGMIDGKSQ